jgi:CRP-like cAMP-binding protein
MLGGDVQLSLCALPLFAQSHPDARQALFDRGVERLYRVGEQVIEEHAASEHLFVIIQGLVGVFYSTPDGDDVLVKVLGAPAVFGEMELFADLPRLEYVETFEPSSIVSFPKDAALAFLQRDVTASYVLLDDVSRRLCIAAVNERSLAFDDVATRLAGLLLSFLEAFRQRDGDELVLDLKLSYPMLARCLGVAVRSVDRVIGAWLKEGWLRRVDGRYRLRDLEQLRRRASPDHLAIYSRLRER